MPVAGDLVIEGLGLQPEARQQLVEECDIILNSAASINFNDPIRDAMQINYFGALRVLELAHQCKKL